MNGMILFLNKLKGCVDIQCEEDLINYIINEILKSLKHSRFHRDPYIRW